MVSYFTWVRPGMSLGKTRKTRHLGGCHKYIYTILWRTSQMEKKKHELKPMSKKRVTRMYQIAPDLVVKGGRSLYQWEYHTNNKALSKALPGLILRSLDKRTMFYRWFEDGEWSAHVLLLKAPRPDQPAKLFKSELMRAVAIARSLRPAPTSPGLYK